MVNIQDIVRITAQIDVPQVTGRARFGNVLFVTTDPTLAGSGGNSVATFANLTEVANEFPTTSPVYAAAQIYFSQSPYPPPLVVGRWSQSASIARVVGGEHDSAEAIEALAATTLTLSQDGADVSISGLGSSPFDGDTSYSSIAASLQAIIRAVSFAGNSDVTVTYDATRGAFVLGGSLNAGVPRQLDFPTGGLATALGWTSEAGGRVLAGAEALTAGDLLANLDAAGADWYWMVTDQSIDDTPAVEELSAAIQATEKQLIVDAQASTLLASPPTGSSANIAALQPSRTSMIYSGSADYKAVSVAALFAGVNFNAANSLITANLKSLPGTLPDALTRTQLGLLRGLNINSYTTFGATPVLTNGTTLQQNIYMDVRYWLDWFVDAVRTAVFNTLASSARIPQTNDGVAQIIETIEGVCLQGRANGGIAPGQVSTATQNDIRSVAHPANFDGQLATGYFVYVQPLAELSEEALARREIPPIHIWLKGSDAIHFVDISATFS